MLLEIGIGLTSMGLGLFIGKYASNTKMFDNYKQERLLKKELKRQARIEAYKQMMPDLVEKMKQDELDKMTGKKRKGNLEKFAKMFETKNASNNNDVLAKMGMNNYGNNDVLAKMGMNANDNKRKKNKKNYDPSLINPTEWL